MENLTKSCQSLEDGKFYIRRKKGQLDAFETAHEYTPDGCGKKSKPAELKGPRRLIHAASFSLGILHAMPQICGGVNGCVEA